MLLRLFLVLILVLLLSCDKVTRSGYREQQTIEIAGNVIDFTTNRVLEDVTVRFYAIWDAEGSTAETNEFGYYQLTASDVFCTEFVDTPLDFDPLWVPVDRYFISATKAGEDTVTYGAFVADIHCFDVLQLVNFKLTHLNHLNK